jgi:pimeloyl-ACP methyl ester carboxylesterase
MSLLQKTSAIVIMIAIGGAMAHAETKPAAKDIVIVHGALVDASGWRGVYDILSKDGFHVTLVQEPLTGLAEDVEATKRAIDQQTGPVVLVGHSYAGSVITEAGVDPKVSSLVYVAALQPDVGEPGGMLMQKFAAPNDAMRAAKNRATPDSSSSSRRRNSVKPMQPMCRRRRRNSWPTRSSSSARKQWPPRPPRLRGAPSRATRF